jgi:hypothetical protein
MKEETRKALEAELTRCEDIRREFSSDEMFTIFAIVRGWTIEYARMEFNKRISLRTSIKHVINSRNEAA